MYVKSRTLGEVAYQAYCEESAGKSLVSGQDLPRWEGLSSDIQDAWIRAALRIFNLGHESE